jgi:hypothetical protein
MNDLLLDKKRQMILLLLAAVIPFFPAFFQYYYIDDGLVMTLAKTVNENGWQDAFGVGFNGHFRPLPILSWGLLYRCFGPDSPVPYYALAFLLHAGNVLLTWSLFQRLFSNARTVLVFSVSLLFAVHWLATEPLNYVSGLGVLWSMAGGLLACHGALVWKAGGRLKAVLLLMTGAIVSLAGGEYGIACYPVIAACALWPWPMGVGRWDWKRGIPIALIVGLIFAGYVGWELGFANHGRVGSSYRFGRHIFEQLRDNIANIAFPSTLIGMDLCFGLIAVGALLGACLSGALRRHLRQPACVLLLGAGLGALLPFSPSLLGNYGRFLYIANPFLNCWLLLLLDRTIDLAPLSGQARRRVLLGAIAVLVLANLYGLERRLITTIKEGEDLRNLVARLRQIERQVPWAKPKLRMVSAGGATVELCLALGLLNLDQVTWSDRPTSLGENDICVVMDNQQPAGQRTHWHFGNSFQQHVLP